MAPFPSLRLPATFDSPIAPFQPPLFHATKPAASSGSSAGCRRRPLNARHLPNSRLRYDPLSAVVRQEDGKQHRAAVLSRSPLVPAGGGSVNRTNPEGLYRQGAPNRAAAAQGAIRQAPGGTVSAARSVPRPRSRSAPIFLRSFTEAETDPIGGRAASPALCRWRRRSCSSARLRLPERRPRVTALRQPAGAAAEAAVAAAPAADMAADAADKTARC